MPINIKKLLFSFLREKEREYRVVIDDGFVVYSGDETVRKFNADDIVEIFAYKVDNFTTDIVCVDILLMDSNTLTITEEMDGFKSMLDKLAELSAFDRDWMSKVVPGPFKENKTLIYSRVSHG